MNKTNSSYVLVLLKSTMLQRAATYNWIKQFTNSGSFKTKDNSSVEENELIKLRKELKQLRMENDILKQAALIIGRK
ncbi:transposase [Spiroplasma endosymbiont of Dactylopius coccus]